MSFSSNPQIEICNECNSNATWYCVHEEANFCDEHRNAAHTLKSQKLHQVVPIDEKNIILEKENTKPKNCENHYIPISSFCSDCKAVCCVLCEKEDAHKDHRDQVKSFSDLPHEQKKTILNEYINKIQMIKQRTISEEDQLNKKLQNLDQNTIQNSQDIDREFDRILDCLNTRRTVLQEELQQKSKMHRDCICLRQEQVKNINSSLNKCEKNVKQMLISNDSSLLSELKSISEKISKFEKDIDQFCPHTQLIDSMPLNISSEIILQRIHGLGNIGVPSTPIFIGQNCQINDTDGNIKWKPIECNPPMTDYVLEIGQNENNFNRIYNGLGTECQLKHLTPDTSYLLRLSASNINGTSSSTILSIKTTKVSNNWTLSMSSIYKELNAENTRESLLDGLFETGVATDKGNSWIQATFPYPVLVTSITIAPLHIKDKPWGAKNGNGGYLQYSNDNTNWIHISNINYIDNQIQTINVNNITAQYWRLFHRSYLGTSSFIFK